MTHDPPRYAVFVSPHGYGHAARASGVMSALHRLNGAHFDIFTTAPEWFFEESLKGLFRYHEAVVDVGFRQASALLADVSATVGALDEQLPYDEAEIERLADIVRMSGCRTVLCDIAPMGVLVAERAGVPSVLVENFTWSWLYEPYIAAHPRLSDHAEYLTAVRARADVRIQTEPLCEREPGAHLVRPISRVPCAERAETRARLDVPDGDRFVVVTMGGYGEKLDFADALTAVDGVTFVMTGAAETKRDGNIRHFANHTPIFMPDLMRAADAVIAKLGYGTIAEVWAEGIPFGFVSRPGFSEMPPLERFVKRELAAIEIAPDDFARGAWTAILPELFAMPRTPRADGGADQAAAIIAAI